MNRRDLYEAVWQEPLVKVAARLRVSDGHLRAACRDAAIPVPGRGHWALAQADRAPAPQKLKGNPLELVRVSKREVAAKLGGGQDLAAAVPPNEVALAEKVDEAKAPAVARPLGVGATDIDSAGPVSVDLSKMRTLGERWMRNEQLIVFIAILEAATSQLPPAQTQRVRAALQSARDALNSQNSIDEIIQKILLH